jgi:steroid delta-isomerase-like uncharacterized protein
MTEISPRLHSLDTIEKYFTALAGGDHRTMEALRCPDYVFDWVHMDAFEDQPLTHEQTNQFWLVWFTGFSDMDYEVTRTIAAESVVVTQWTFIGTHDGLIGSPVFDPPLNPTGKTIRIRGISVYDIHDGMIQKETMYIDLATLYVEMGISA